MNTLVSAPVVALYPDVQYGTKSRLIAYRCKNAVHHNLRKQRAHFQHTTADILQRTGQRLLSDILWGDSLGASIVAVDSKFNTPGVTTIQRQQWSA